MNAFFPLSGNCIMAELALPQERAACVVGPQWKIGPFCASPPWAKLPFMEGLAAEWATREYHSFLAVAPQLVACPLTQCYGEWKLSCVLTEWMDRTLRLGYSLQFCSIPSPFRGIREANLSSQSRQRFRSCCKNRRCLLCTQDREKGHYSMYFLKALSWKTALLLALNSAKRVSELTALSVHPSCLLIRVTVAGRHSDRTPPLLPRA